MHQHQLGRMADRIPGHCWMWPQKYFLKTVLLVPQRFARRLCQQILQVALARALPAIDTDRKQIILKPERSEGESDQGMETVATSPQFPKAGNQVGSRTLPHRSA
jgi:hypothetical protein